MSDFVSHLRFVHNTQTILSMVIIYLIVSTWTFGTELRRDLYGFLRTIEVARTVIEVPERLADLGTEMPNHDAALRDELMSAIGHAVLTVAPLRIWPVTSLPNESSPVGTQWQGLQNQEWIVETLGHLEDDLTEVRMWLDERQPDLVRLRRDLQPNRRRPREQLSTQDIRRLTTPIVLPSIVDWPVDASSGFAVVELEAYVPIRLRSIRRGRCEDGDATGIADRRGLREIWRQYVEIGITMDCRTFGPYRFVIQTDTVRLLPSTFDEYPYLSGELEAIADLTPNDALAWGGKPTSGWDPRARSEILRNIHQRGTSRYRRACHDDCSPHLPSYHALQPANFHSERII